MKKERGITLIALVITIIVLLILAGISIATLTGENGVLTKASGAKKDTDIVETKEQIKLELMGNYDEQKTTYTNQDVIDAVAKITKVTVDENAETVKSQKGNDVDISDLWIEGELWDIPIKVSWIIDGEKTLSRVYVLRHPPVVNIDELVGAELEPGVSLIIFRDYLIVGIDYSGGGHMETDEGSYVQAAYDEGGLLYSKAFAMGLKEEHPFVQYLLSHGYSYDE